MEPEIAVWIRAAAVAPRQCRDARLARSLAASDI
jgi:hypothetical protein